MKKMILSLAGALGLAFAYPVPASACDTGCDCDKAAHAKDEGKAQKVALEGTVVSFGCPIQAEKKQCTGAALVVGDQKHLIKKAQKGSELVTKAKDSKRVVKVTGTKQGEFITIASYSIKS
jgi:hypothetical protein